MLNECDELIMKIKDFFQCLKAKEGHHNYIHLRRSAKELIDSVSVSIVMPL